MISPTQAPDKPATSNTQTVNLGSRKTSIINEHPTAYIEWRLNKVTGLNELWQMWESYEINALTHAHIQTIHEWKLVPTRMEEASNGQ